MTARKRAPIIAVGIALALGLTACASGGTPDAKSESATIKFWAFNAGQQTATNVYNKLGGKIKVDVSVIPNATVAMTKYRTAIQAGNAPCLAQMPYDQILSFASNGLLEDVTAQAAKYKKSYTPFAWSLTGFQGNVYGIPQDTAPMVFYYRKDLFTKYGLTVPTTFTEYKAEAEKLKSEAPGVQMAYLGTDDSSNLESYAWQAGAQWMSTSGKTWVVNTNDSATKKVTGFWQSMIDEGLVNLGKRWDATFYQGMNNGQLIGYIAPSWAASTFSQNIGATPNGTWQVAPMPVWPGSTATANAGGSAMVVLKGCKNPVQALSFANWLNSSKASINILADPSGPAGIYPASIVASNYKIVNEHVKFFGGQNIYTYFKKSAATVPSGWHYGPVNTDLMGFLADQYQGVQPGTTTLPAIFKAMQPKAITLMADKGLTVSAGK